jgi:ribosomal protein S18 acetylase RimI-like enzyme
MTDLRIRTAVDADVAALRTIYRESSLANPSDRDVLLAHPEVLEWDATVVIEGRTRVAIIGETIVGFATLRTDGASTELEDLFVDPAWMRRGIGSALVRDAVALVAARGGATLDVVANPNAMAFYAQVGFRPKAERDTQFGAAILMRREVEAPP